MISVGLMRSTMGEGDDPKSTVGVPPALLNPVPVIVAVVPPPVGPELGVMPPAAIDGKATYVNVSGEATVLVP